MLREKKEKRIAPHGIKNKSDAQQYWLSVLANMNGGFSTSFATIVTLPQSPPFHLSPSKVVSITFSGLQIYRMLLKDGIYLAARRKVNDVDFSMFPPKSQDTKLN